MKTLEHREQNLFNATETMAQFYDEIESFLSILYSNMERAGFVVKNERLRSGTFAVKNLTRRLLATASIMYIKDNGKLGEIDEEEDDEGAEMEGKPAKDTDITILKDSKIPLVTIHLFNPKSIPTAHTLSYPFGKPEKYFERGKKIELRQRPNGEDQSSVAGDMCSVVSTS